MKRLWVLPVVVALILALMVSPDLARSDRRALVVRMGFLMLVAVAIGALIAFWILTIADLLRRGPGAQREWWIAVLIVVVVLGPLGAIAYRIAQPTFEVTNERAGKASRTPLT